MKHSQARAVFRRRSPAVHADPVYGWHPTIITAPAKAIDAQVAAERAAQELRALYDLTDERRDNDRRPVNRPLIVIVEGREQSLRTLGNAISFLTRKLGHRAASNNWQCAVEAIAAAQDDYTEGHCDLATNLVEHICRTEGVLGKL